MRIARPARKIASDEINVRGALAHRLYRRSLVLRVPKRL